MRQVLIAEHRGGIGDDSCSREILFAVFSQETCFLNAWKFRKEFAGREKAGREETGREETARALTRAWFFLNAPPDRW
ncbi:MAG: hypothetical protein C0478_12240 [Planctomyces sp.]|nr:hypothetical protein [Planctomyces sp.]